MSKKSKEMPYEEALGALETTLEAIEAGDIPLADLVDKFAASTRLLRVCEQRLKEAELTIEKLTEERAEDGSAVFEPVKDLS